MKKNNIPIEDNNVLKGAIAPMGLDFSPNTRFYMGDYICRIYVIMQYPPTQDYGWIAKINNITGTTITITSVPIEGINVIEQLSKIVNTAKSDAINSKDTLIQQRKLKIAEDTERLMIEID